MTRLAKNIILAITVLSVLNSCNREPIPPPEPVVERISVAGLRKMFEKGVTKIDTNIYIKGIVTLTPELGNIPAFIAYMQDSTAGICLTVAGENTFAMNSEVKILCRGASFTEFNGLLQFGDITIKDQCEVIKLNATPFIRTATIDELLSGKYQAEYVMIKAVQFKDPGSFSGTKILTDCNSQIEVYTRPDATFSGNSLPVGNGVLKGVASVYTDKQILIRESTELDMTSARCGVSTVYLNQDFNSLAKNADVSTLSGWKTYSENGTKTWYGNDVSGRKWVQATAYSSGQANVTTWMVSPPVDLSRASKPYISFESANGYDNGATLELYVSTKYTGTATPWTSEWTKLNVTLPASSATGYSQFVPSGQVDLSLFKREQVYFAWVYKGSDPAGSTSDKTTTWEVDNIVVGDK